MHRVDFARDDVDVAVRHGDGSWPGLEATRPCAEQISPKLIVGRDRLRRPAEVKWPLLRLDDQSKAWGAVVYTCRGNSTGAIPGACS